MNRSTKIDISESIHDKILAPGKTAGSMALPYPLEETGDDFFGNHYTIYFPFSTHAFLVPPIVAVFEKIMVYVTLILALPLVALRVPYVLFKQRRDEETSLVFALKFVPRLLRKELGVCLGFFTLPVLLLANMAKLTGLIIKSIFQRGF